MDDATSLAFIDVETTGLSPRTDRITEIGVVTVTHGAVERWATLVNVAGRPRDRAHYQRPRSGVDDSDAPRFADVAPTLRSMLGDRLLIAHNARFDFAFLRAEFERVNVEFQPDIVCSVMLSRRLYPHLAHHDLDSLASHHGLNVDVRHRALPDADLLWQFWQALRRDHGLPQVAASIADLLAGPVLPTHMDPSLIDRLPDAPGAYVMHDEHNTPMHVGAAENLRLHVRDYFRIDRASTSALAMSHRVTNITWNAMQGPLGARLRALELESTLALGARARTSGAPSLAWSIVPNMVPAVALVSLADDGISDSYGLFSSERKARNALQRIATRRRLCHAMLGIADGEGEACLACPVDGTGSSCARRVDRAVQLTRILIALKPMQLPRWPYAGAIGIRERRDMHVFDRWRYLGTATHEGEVHSLLLQARGDFERAVFDLLRHALPRLPRVRIVDLAPHCVDRAPSSECEAA